DVAGLRAGDRHLGDIAVEMIRAGIAGTRPGGAHRVGLHSAGDTRLDSEANDQHAGHDRQDKRQKSTMRRPIHLEPPDSELLCQRCVSRARYAVGCRTNGPRSAAPKYAVRPGLEIDRIAWLALKLCQPVLRRLTVWIDAQSLPKTIGLLALARDLRGEP